MSERREGTPNSYIWTGLVLAAVTGVLGGAAGLDEPAGVMVVVIGAAISQVMLGIGIVAKGVELGTRARR